MSGRNWFLALVAVLATGLAVSASGFSSATFTSTSANPGTVQAASDWTPPRVTVGNPGSSVQGNVGLSAGASDAESGVASVSIQYQAVGAGEWVTVCTDSTSPYACAWNTTTVTDGQYDVRARATDNAGLSASSDNVRTVVANSLSVVLANPGDVLRGTVPLSATVHGGASLTWGVTIEYLLAGTTTWRTACTAGGLLGGSFGCSWNTTEVSSNDYDLRAVARPTLGPAYYSNVVADIAVDNTAPTVTMTDPGSPLRGAVTFGATATDAHSGVAKVEIQYARSPSTTYQGLCTVTAEPFSCRVNTATIADGSYSFRAVATDIAGNSTTSTAIARAVDNTVSSVAVEDPGAFLTGTVAVTATANSTAGVASVLIQRAPAGTNTWTSVCSDATAPYTCSWNTTTVADGLYDLRAVLTDGQSRTTTSAVVTGRRVDNSPLRAIDVQAANGTGTPGRADAGDTLTFTYSQVVNLGSISPGWTGASLNVTARLRDGNLVGAGNTGDTLDVVRPGTTTPLALGSVNLRGEYVRSSRTVTFGATLTAATVTVSGVDRTVVTLRFGSQLTGSNSLRTSSTSAAMVWSPSGAVTTPDGTRTCSTAPATETGTADRDL